MQTAYPVEFASMTEAEINAMPPDDYCDALYATMETKKPLLTCEDIKEIEAELERQGRNRRAALLLLTKPWALVNQQVTEDRGFAVAVAQIHMLADEAKLYKGLAELMEQAVVWSMLALANRKDMDEVIEEAKAFE